MRGLFVTGTGTGVGKTILAACLLAAMRTSGERVRAHKPVLTGVDEPPSEWPPDHELLALAAGMQPQEVAPLRYGAPLSPHLASALAGQRIDPPRLIENARSAASEGDSVVVEGIGGLLVPLTDRYTVCDLARELGLPVLIAARPGLGTINHTLLTLHAARDAGLDVRAVVLTPWPEHPSAMHLSNRDTIARLGDIEVRDLPTVEGPSVHALVRAAATLPVGNWLGRAP